MKKTPWLFRVHVGDDILPKYEGIRINYKKDPLLNNDSMESKVVFVLWLKCLPFSWNRPRQSWYLQVWQAGPGYSFIEKKNMAEMRIFWIPS